MFDPLFRQLQLRANLLTDNDSVAVPVLSKGLDQIEAETNRLNERIKPTQEVQAKAHYFLTNGGINTQNVLKPLNTSTSFQDIHEDRHVDMEKFLREAHEIMIIENIEDRRNQDHDEFDIFYEREMAQLWESTKKRSKQEKENKLQYKDFGSGDNAIALNMLNQYFEAVMEINKKRVKGEVCDVIGILSKITNPSGLDSTQKSVKKAWETLNYITTAGMEPNTMNLQGYYLRDYIAQPYSSLQAVHSRRKLLNASKSWLEKQYLQHIEDELIAKAHTMHIGGIPSITHRIRKYIEMNYQNNGEWTDRRLEIVEGLPIWLFIFLLIRSGHWKAVDKFMDESPEFFINDPDFMTYYNEYRHSPNQCLSKTNQEKILNDYYRLEYGGNDADPYKLIVYKVIGRCELHKMALPDTIKTTKDDIWLQISLVREVTDTERYEFERYRLIDLQNEVNNNKDNWSIDDDSQWAYFTVLLLTLQFEKAIEHLYNIKNLHVEAVHIAIALSYYGLLFISSSETASRSDLLIMENNQPLLNFGRLIHQYVYVFLYDKPTQALQYIYLLSLYSVYSGYTSNEMVDLCRSYVCDLILRSKDFKAVLGYVTGNNQAELPDKVEPLLKLAEIDSKADSINHILFPLAKSCVQMGRCEDAVYTYALSQDYNKVIDVLIKQLSDALQKPQSTREMDPTLSELSNQDIIQFSTNTMQEYTHHPQVKDLIDGNKQITVNTLIQLVKFKVLYEAGEYNQALQLVKNAALFPLDNNMPVDQAVHKFSQLDEAIRKNIPELLLNVTDILYKMWISLSENAIANATTLSNIETSIRHILVFVGIIPFSMPADIVTRLNQAEIMLSERKIY